MINESSVRDTEAYKVLREALQALLLKFPLAGLSYMGATVEVLEDSDHRHTETVSTDGRRIFYNAEFIKSIGRRQRIFDALHEWLHIFFNHVARRGDRNGKLWNEACDYVVILEGIRILTSGNDTWTAPLDGYQPPEWAKGLTAEQIYDRLMAGATKSPKPSGGNGLPNGSDFLPPAEERPDEEEIFRQSFADELAQASLIQEQIHHTPIAAMYGEAIASRLAQILKGKVPWSRLLRGDLIGEMGDEFPTYAPPNPLYYPEIVLPAMRSPREKKLLIGVDVSASVGKRLFDEFVANVTPAAARANTCIIVTFDAVVRECIRTTHARQALQKVKFLTGAHSHTSTLGLFEIVEKEKPTAITILTDGMVYVPTKPYPKTLWVLPHNGPQMPWGRSYKMDISW